MPGRHRRPTTPAPVAETLAQRLTRGSAVVEHEAPIVTFVIVAAIVAFLLLLPVLTR